MTTAAGYLTHQLEPGDIPAIATISARSTEAAGPGAVTDLTLQPPGWVRSAPLAIPARLAGSAPSGSGPDPGGKGPDPWEDRRRASPGTGPSQALRRP